MCLPFTHKWKFELIQSIACRDSDTRLVYQYKHIYVGTCQKCGKIKKKIILT